MKVEEARVVWISDLSTQKWLSFRNPVHVYSIHPTRRCEKKGNIYAFKGRYLAMPEHTACVHVKRSIEMRFYVMSQMRTILLADAHTVDVKSLLCAFTVIIFSFSLYHFLQYKHLP